MKPRIGNKQAVYFIIGAFIIDLVSIIPLFNIVTDAVAQIFLPILFKRYGVNMISTKNFALYLTTWVVEAIPDLSIIPAITIETAVVIWTSRREDKKAAQISK